MNPQLKLYDHKLKTITEHSMKVEFIFNFMVLLIN